MAASPPTRVEGAGPRSRAFADWHRRALPAWAFATDLDCLEVRKGRGVVAAIEHAEAAGLLTECRARAILACKRIQAAVVRDVARALQVPGLFVLHDPAMCQAVVIDLLTNEARQMSSDDLASMLESL